MTEREYYREPGAPPRRREVYQETVTDRTTEPLVDDMERDFYREHAYGPAGEQVVHSEHVSVPSPAARRAAAVARIKQVIYFLLGVINALLVIRFIFLLLAANSGSPFVSLIYGLSQPLVSPFQGIFAEPSFDGSVVEWASLVAIIVYSLVAYGLARLVELAYAPASHTSAHDL